MKLIYISTLFILLLSCKKEEVTEPIKKPPKITFTLTDSEESKISTIDVLVFKADEIDPSKEYFAYKSEGRNISNENTNEKQFDLNIVSEPGNFRFVILANCRNEIEALGELNTSLTKEYVTSRIIKHNESNWETNDQSPNYIDIPMWGQSDLIEVTNNQDITVHLLRMLSRVDINILKSAQGNFKLKSIRVYNYNTYGRVVPNTTETYWNGKKVLKATEPENAGKVFGPLLYNQLSTPNISINREIYLFEASSDTESPTFLVIGGEYNGESETYYKFEFANIIQKQNLNFSDILRNHVFEINISQVTGKGYSTPEEALNSSAVNITGDIKIWETSDYNEIIYDGQYHLALSKSKYTLPLNKSDNINEIYSLSITTNYPTGWIIEKIVDKNDIAVNWLSLSSMSGPQNINSDIRLNLDENDTGEEREAFIHIKAGKIKYTIQVTQTIIPDLNLTIEDGEGNEISTLFFNSNIDGTVPSQNLVIKWSASSTNNAALETVAETLPFDFGNGDEIVSGLINGNGIKTYTIQPPAITQSEADNNPFIEKTYKIEFTVNNGSNNITKYLYLIQKNFAAKPNVETNFVSDGNNQYFIINANAPWRIELNNDPYENIEQILTTQGGENGNKQDEIIYLKTRNYTSDPLRTESSATLKLISTDSSRKFEDQIITIPFYSGEIQVPSNCYLLKTSDVLSKSYLIPVSRANEAFAGAIGDNDLFTSEFVWADALANINTYKIIPVGRGANGYIYVYPGTQQGNTVIAAKVNNIVKWSWHLWTMNEEIQTRTLGTYTLLDRNIGALNNTPGNYYSVGVHFQWGRKDPFPPPQGNNSNINERIYNKQGEIMSITTYSSSATLLYSIENPFTYLAESTGWKGSAGSASWNNNGKKTIYDPSPPGWKVAPSAVWQPLNTSNFVWNGTNRGRTHSTAGWFPVAGRRGRTNSNLTAVGATGSYCSSNYSTSYAQTLDIRSDRVDPNTNYFYVEATSIRCIKE